jgi:hypothetical protein
MTRSELTEKLTLLKGHARAMVRELSEEIDASDFGDAIESAAELSHIVAWLQSWELKLADMEGVE